MAAACSFLETHRRLFFLGIFALFLLAAGVGISVVQAEKFGDWYMHVGMWAILGVYVLITSMGLSAGRKVGPIANLALMGLFSGFWIWTLFSLIPGGLALVDHSWQNRPELTILWAPIVMLALVWCFLLVMTIGLWGRTEAPVPAPISSAPVPVPVSAPAGPVQTAAPVALENVEPPVEKE